MGKRSSFLKSRHTRARQQRNFYEQVTGERGKYSDFLRNENPLLDKVVAYDVSYQLSYSSEKNSLFIKSPETFRVYAFRSDMTEDAIFTNTKDAVMNMKSRDGNGFSLETKKRINEGRKLKLNVEANKIDPRGFEESRSLNINQEMINKLRAGNGLYVEKNDQNISIKGGKGKKTSKANMTVDLSTYF